MRRHYCPRHGKEDCDAPDDDGSGDTLRACHKQSEDRVPYLKGWKNDPYDTVWRKRLD